MAKVKVSVEIEVDDTTEAEINAVAGHHLIEVKHALRRALTDPLGTVGVSPPVLRIGSRLL